MLKLYEIHFLTVTRLQLKVIITVQEDLGCLKKIWLKFLRKIRGKYEERLKKIILIKFTDKSVFINDKYFQEKRKLKNI